MKPSSSFAGVSGAADRENAAAFSRAGAAQQHEAPGPTDAMIEWIEENGPEGATFADDVRWGLTSTPKRLNPRWFYDERGSGLYERITAVPEYYPTRTEAEILGANIVDILTAAGDPNHVVELGSGSSAKTRIILKHLRVADPPVVYHPIDISGAALADAVPALRREFPHIAVEGHVGQYRPVLFRLHEDLSGKTFILFLGSSIGNMEPADAVELLRFVGCAMDAEDSFLLGTDMVKDVAVLEAAYNDAEGVTAAFNRNVLGRINRELDGAFDVATFRHRAFWNQKKSRIEMHLESTIDQTVPIAALGLEVRFAKGETIHTENSHKYTDEMVDAMARDAGLRVTRRWIDARGWFAVSLLARPGEGGGSG